MLLPFVCCVLADVIANVADVIAIYNLFCCIFLADLFARFG